MKTALIFPGQGAQTVGMAKDFAEAFAVAKSLFNSACDIVGYDLAKLCFEGPQEKLDTTGISQPAIFTASVAMLEVLKTEGLITEPYAAAGLSLGEYTALYAAGVFSFEEGLKLVDKRGRAMQAAADKSKGAMVSIIGLDESRISELCQKASQGQMLVPANFNCPGQVVISGAVEACERAAGLAERMGAIKAVKLAVAGAFHSQFMSPAADAVADALKNTRLGNPQCKVMANINAEYYGSKNEISQGLVKQLTSPILWQKCCENMIADGIDVFIEIGPGRVLTGLMKRINRKQKIENISTIGNIETISKN